MPALARLDANAFVLEPSDSSARARDPFELHVKAALGRDLSLEWTLNAKVVSTLTVAEHVDLGVVYAPLRDFDFRGEHTEVPAFDVTLFVN